MAAVHIPNTVVTSTVTLPIPNPITGVNPPVIIAGEGAGEILAPLELTAIASGVIGAPVITTPEVAADIAVPAITTAQSIPATALPALLTDIAQPATAIPVLVASESVPVSATPVLATSESIPATAIPTLLNDVDQPAIVIPAIVSPESVPATAIPALVASESVPASALPSVLPPIALPSSTPPYALNHARILYDNLLLGSTVSINAGANGGFTLIPNTADRWTVTNGGAITFELAEAVDMDTVCIGSHNLGSVGYATGVEYSPDLVTAFAAFKVGQNPPDDAALMFHNTSTVSVRRLKVTISGTGNAFVGSIYAGIALQMQRPFFSGYSPLPLAAKTIKYMSRTEGGNIIGTDIRRIGYSSSASWSNLENDWYRFYFQPFVISARTLPFYFSWNQLQYPLDVGYCMTSEDITPSYSGTLDYFNVSFDLEAVQ